MNNIYHSQLEKKGRPLFIPFTVLGDPDKTTSLTIIKTLIDAGADTLELGMPYSDPAADGPVIQAADKCALSAGIRTQDCFDILREVRTMTDIPMSLLMYYNLILQFGIDDFYRTCSASGVNSVLIADLPLEHLHEILPSAKKYGITPIILISELTTEQRMREVAKVAEGYLYLVSYIGVTGIENAILKEKIEENIKRTRRFTDLPIFVGFGINTREQVTAVIEAGADGYIIGSRIVKEIPNLEKITEICHELQGT